MFDVLGFMVYLTAGYHCCAVCIICIDYYYPRRFGIVGIYLRLLNRFVFFAQVSTSTSRCKLDIRRRVECGFTPMLYF